MKFAQIIEFKTNSNRPETAEFAALLVGISDGPLTFRKPRCSA